MNRKQSLFTLTKRLLKIASTMKKYFIISTIVSILGNAAQMGLMGFGAGFILSVAGKLSLNRNLYCGLMIISAVLIVVCRYLEGYFSHVGAYELLAKMSIDMFGRLKA